MVGSEYRAAEKSVPDDHDVLKVRASGHLAPLTDCRDSDQEHFQSVRELDLE
jgi:hypothetical protein